MAIKIQRPSPSQEVIVVFLLLCLQDLVEVFVTLIHTVETQHGFSRNLFIKLLNKEVLTHTLFFSKLILPHGSTVSSAQWQIRKLQLGLFCFVSLLCQLNSSGGCTKRASCHWTRTLPGSASCASLRSLLPLSLLKYAYLTGYIFSNLSRPEVVGKLSRAIVQLCCPDPLHSQDKRTEIVSGTFGRLSTHYATHGKCIRILGCVVNASIASVPADPTLKLELFRW